MFPVNAQFAIDRALVGMNCCNSDKQRLSDQKIAQALSHERQYLRFSFRERLARRWNKLFAELLEPYRDLPGMEQPAA